MTLRIKNAPKRNRVSELLTMDRSGEFMIKTSGRSHCGIKEDLIVKYDMQCVCSPKLDNRGFLFDQINVDNYFQALKKTRKSCERLVKSCLQDLINMIETENPKCEIHRMSLTLSPEPHKASMTYTWKSKNAPAELHTNP